MADDENKPTKPRREVALIVAAGWSTVGSCDSCAYQGTRKPHEPSIIEDVDSLWMSLTVLALVVWFMLLRKLRSQ